MLICGEKGGTGLDLLFPWLHPLVAPRGENSHSVHDFALIFLIYMHAESLVYTLVSRLLL